jgi:acetyl/propionyl-CoA carboxylase alpha subunit
VSTFYDPMISKLIAWGSTREEATQRMLRALHEYVVVGPVTNVAFHRWALQQPDFRSGDIDTGFIGRLWKPGALAAGTADLPVIGAALATLTRAVAPSRNGGGPTGAATASRWRHVARREALRG